VNVARLALERAQLRLVGRLDKLEECLAAGDEAAWASYCEVVAALAVVVTAQTAPGASGQLLTTRQLAERLQLSPRTVRRKVKAGELTPVRLGARGRGAVRWSAG
jgi:excisionase family DNA binding protein